MSLLLSRDQLTELTGAVRPSAMMAWLDARGWVYERPQKRGDIPKVAVAYFDARMSGKPLGASRRSAPRIDFMFAE